MYIAEELGQPAQSTVDEAGGEQYKAPDSISAILYPDDAKAKKEDLQKKLENCKSQWTMALQNNKSIPEKTKNDMKLWFIKIQNMIDKMDTQKDFDEANVEIATFGR